MADDIKDPEDPDEALSEDDLEAVAGGMVVDPPHPLGEAL